MIPRQFRSDVKDTGWIVNVDVEIAKEDNSGGHGTYRC